MRVGLRFRDLEEATKDEEDYAPGGGARSGVRGRGDGGCRASACALWVTNISYKFWWAVGTEEPQL